MVAKETKKKMSLLAAYVCMMSVATVSRAVTPPGRELKYNSAVAVLFTLAAFFPLQPVVLGVALCVRIVAILCSMPYVHDAQYWCMLTDATLLVSLLSTLMRRVSDNTNTNNNKKKKKNLREQLAALDASEATTVIRSAAATIRIELILLYTAAALWKANEGFLHPRFSCAPIYMMQLVEQWLPADLLAPSRRTSPRLADCHCASTDPRGRNSDASSVAATAACRCRICWHLPHHHCDHAAAQYNWYVSSSPRCRPQVSHPPLSLMRKG